jgi:hypothetical protein
MLKLNNAKILYGTFLPKFLLPESKYKVYKNPIAEK